MYVIYTSIYSSIYNVCVYVLYLFALKKGRSLLIFQILTGNKLAHIYNICEEFTGSICHWNCVDWKSRPCCYFHSCETQRESGFLCEDSVLLIYNLLSATALYYSVKVRIALQRKILPGSFKKNFSLTVSCISPCARATSWNLTNSVNRGTNID